MPDSSNARPGAAASPDDGADALRSGARVAEFEIRQVLGAGGFGIVYRAWDEALQRDVALKEYMPVSMAGRGTGERVTLRSRSHEESFALGLQSFVNEARLLARFDQPALVKVLRFWEANGTAYMAMPLYKGRTLRQLRKETRPEAFGDAWIRALVEPLLDALEVMHGAGITHRDIAPDNIIWCDDNRPVLLDFGAARLVLADRTQNLTAILKPQFAPIEQYAETPAMRQGPWTDLYALASTCYYMLTGRSPVPATARVLADELAPLARLAPPGCSPRLLQALDWAMAVRPQDRPQSVAQWRDALAGRIAAPSRAQAPGPASAPGAADGYEKTVQVTRRAAADPFDETQPAPRSPAPRPRDHVDLDNAERSVVLPPKSGLPLKALVAVLAVAAAAAGAWTTRQQWLPAIGLQAAAQGASSATSAASEAAAVASAPAVAADAASAASAAMPPIASDAASTVAPASAAATFAPVRTATTEADPDPAAEPAPVPAARPKAVAARARPQNTRPAGFVLPPPVLPPPNEAQAATQPAPVASATPAAAEATVPAVRALRGPREVCMDQDPTNPIACVKRLCENEPRYKFYPACQRVRRNEDR